ncbi:hypothetical protein ACFWSF_26585 [Streptomyces sp. NPDC058611]|uniref:hypothetical protein n=1 Tax=unclassified Streptomyces TaxID=2593676 RepID=UPI0036657351
MEVPAGRCRLQPVVILSQCLQSRPGQQAGQWVWAHVKRSLAVMALDRLETLVRNRLKRLQYPPHTLDGFIAGTGLTLDTPISP